MFVFAGYQIRPGLRHFFAVQHGRVYCHNGGYYADNRVILFVVAQVDVVVAKILIHRFDRAVKLFVVDKGAHKLFVEKEVEARRKQNVRQVFFFARLCLFDNPIDAQIGRT